MDRSNDSKKQSSATRQLIKDAFIRLYQEKPLSKLSISEITNECHISRGTFYLYYEDIFQLLESLEDEFLAGVMFLNSPTILEALKRSQTMDAYVQSYAQMLHFIVENRTVFRALLNGSESERFRKKYIDGIKSNIFTMLEIDKQVPREQWDLCCAFQAGGIINLFETWLNEDFQSAPENVAAIVYKALFLGLMNPAKSWTSAV